MRCILRNQIDPYFNIAAEEYVLHNFKDDCFMLWRNEPCVVLGKHQNALAEINYEFVRLNNIKVIRRISGGGCVYHDAGNVNFSFASNGEIGKLVDFKRFTQPIINVLSSLGVDAQFGGRNDLRIGEKKISGNAEHVYKNRVLHHGTLLFETQLSQLSMALQVVEGKYNDKAIKSVRSQVTNIIDHLPAKIRIDDFMHRLIRHMLSTNPLAQIYSFSAIEMESISLLAKSKYASWEWNFAYSPPYKFRNKLHFNDELAEIEFGVHQGIIEECSFRGSEGMQPILNHIGNLLPGLPHRYHEIVLALNEPKLNLSSFKISPEEIASQLF